MECWILFFVIFCSCSIFSFPANEPDFIISRKALQQLDEWEIKVLRDFVRGRGRPIVERIPLDNLEEPTNFPGWSSTEDESSLIDLMNPMVVPQGGMTAKELPKSSKEAPLKVPQPITQIIMPTSKKKPKGGIPTSTKPKMIPRKNEENHPSVEDYEQLASVIQMFIDRRSNRQGKSEKPKKEMENKLNLNQIHRKMEKSSTLPEQIITSENGNQQVTFENKWTPVQRFTNGKNQSKKKQEITHNPTKNEKNSNEQRMKQLSSELTKILKQLEESKAERQPQLFIVRNGSAEQTADGQYIFIATITLVKDNGKSILIDTGLGTHINARTELLKSLEKLNVNPASIDIVVTTHGHPDHSGGVHDFPDALHFQSWYSHFRTKFNLTSLFENESMSITDNVMIVKAKGHTSEDIAVIVRDVKGKGDVLISGDLFIRNEDVDHPMMWQPLSSDVISQRDSRRRYGCVVDWIVPGHGSIFQVTKNIKKFLKC